MKNIRSSLLIVILIPVIFISCIPQRRLTYLQDQMAVGDHIPAGEKKYTLKPGDILYIRVMTTNQEMNELFNIDERRGAYRSTDGAVSDPYMFVHGYNINQNGYIQLPVIGAVSVAGISVEEVHKLIQERTMEYLLDTTISVRLVNFKATLLGEASGRGIYKIFHEEFSIMDTIGLVGGKTDYGKRKLNFGRKTDKGRQIARIDISDLQAIKTDFYLLQPNDVIYVEPMLAKLFALAQFPMQHFYRYFHSCFYYQLYNLTNQYDHEI